MATSCRRALWSKNRAACPASSRPPTTATCATAKATGRRVWLLSSHIAILKAADHEPGRCSRSLKAMLQNDDLASVWEVFDHILSAPVNTYHQLDNDYNDVLLPGFRRLHESTAIFVDNID